MTDVARVSAFGRQAANVGRALPFSESIGSPDDLPEALAAALKTALGAEADALQLIIHSPAFATVGQSSPENVFALTSTRWILVAKTATGTVTSTAPFAAAAVIELTMILLGGQLRIESVAGAAGCAVGFNMVSIELFREALFIMLAGARPAATNPTRGGNIEAELSVLSFKFRTALQEQTPSGVALRDVRSWTSEVSPLARLLFMKPAAPAGVLAVTDSYLGVITDPPAGKEKQHKGKSPHGKIATYVLRQHPLVLHLPQPQRRGDSTVRIAIESDVGFALSVPARQIGGIASLLSALLPPATA
ncbi:hypothetical protein [Niveibacterium microcysteis]|uniref:Uncharacterized protein n=1 Tax=Niveibacterium microcysteis TaxID=2811415 RepID=A0ABX7MAV7_9RHOO|nr:hypothetical protein [Niveibacterium microcysteis]QSI77863.1 hypothetical protein JY500_04210 [Niveibacterium microcysteis]